MPALIPAPMTGTQEPTACSFPDYVSSSGEEAIELAAMAGLMLDPWQRLVLRHALGEDSSSRWAAFEVAIVVSRQNGKGAILEARELAGLFLFGERLIIHSAHEFSTSLEAFRRLLTLIEDTPDFERRVKRVSRAHGEEGIELKGGQRIRFRTRTKGGGRGFTSDCLILDEAMILPEAMHGALLPTLSARPNPQVFYAGSAVDQLVHDDGIVFARVRERGRRGDDPGLAFFEWSADHESPSDVPAAGAASRDVWARANPGLGIRISEEHIANEQRSMDARTFAVERLGVGDWPSSGTVAGLPLDRWDALADKDSRAEDPVVLAFDVSPDRSSSSIGAAGRRSDGLAHVEVVENRRGTGWVVPMLIELAARHAPSAVVCDGAGPAGSLLSELAQAGIEVVTVSAPEHAQACGLLYDAVDQGGLRHLGAAGLNAAVAGAAKRPLGEAWAWSRKNSGVDITGLVAVTLAHWQLARTAEEEEDILFAAVSI